MSDWPDLSGWPDAPYRRVEVHEPRDVAGKTVYVAILECGHTHAAELDRRYVRCNQCATNDVLMQRVR